MELDIFGMKYICGIGLTLIFGRIMMQAKK